MLKLNAKDKPYCLCFMFLFKKIILRIPLFLLLF